MKINHWFFDSDDNKVEKKEYIYKWYNDLNKKNANFKNIQQILIW